MAPSSLVRTLYRPGLRRRWRFPASVGPAGPPALGGELLGLEEPPHELVVGRDDRHFRRGRPVAVEHAPGRLGQPGEIVGHVALLAGTAPAALGPRGWIA